MTWDDDTTRPSAVDMIAARMPTPINAASQGGNNSMKSIGKAWFWLSSVSPSIALASRPPSPSMPSVIPKAKASLMNERCWPVSFNAHSLLPRCGSRPNGRWATTMQAIDHQEW